MRSTKVGGASLPEVICRVDLVKQLDAVTNLLREANL